MCALWKLSDDFTWYVHQKQDVGTYYDNRYVAELHMHVCGQMI